MMPECKNCRWFRPLLESRVGRETAQRAGFNQAWLFDAAHAGDCLRRAPQCSYDPELRTIPNAYFPRVRIDDGCGDYEERKA